MRPRNQISDPAVHIPNVSPEDTLRGKQIEYMSIDQLSTLMPNVRKPNRHQRRKLVKSLRRFGHVIPVLVNVRNEVIAGQQVVDALKATGAKEVAIIRLDHLMDIEVRTLSIALNRLGEDSTWEPTELKLAFEGILEIDPVFDLTDTGFETPEIDLILDDVSVESEIDSAADALPAGSLSRPVSKPGDLWELGSRHRLLCGNATDDADFDCLMDGKVAAMAITDPPYNVNINGNVGGLGSIKHEEFQMASGEMTPEEFISFLRLVFSQLVSNSNDGSIHYIFMDWRHLEEITTAAKGLYTDLKNLCIWNKNNGGMGSLYRSKHELVFVFKNGTAAHINNVELGRHSRNRTNVWDYAGVNTFRQGRMDELAMHPTVKPVALVADAIKDCSNRGDIILDPFMGSGTTIIAAEKTGRCAFGIEIEPKYVDTAIRRWQDYTGEHVIHAQTGATFNEMAAQRDFKESDDA